MYKTMEDTWLNYERSMTSGAVGWDHEEFDHIRRIIEEEETFLSQSVNVQEGVECKKCKSTQTYTYQKQVRAADEGFTSFTLCFNCDHQTVE
jgi:DNA-directed RNA polymerase subunit M/transcription elongation factor TFIIS